MPSDFALILVVFAVVVPLNGRARMRKLLAQPQVSPRDRLTLYVTTIAFQWATSVIIAWRCWVHGISPAALGLDFSNASRILPPTLLGGALLFAMAALERWGWSNPAVILSTSLLFGLGHMYQGRPGVLSTILLGALFALAKTLYGSLIPPMVWHFTVDMAAALGAARFRLEASSFRTKLT